MIGESNIKAKRPSNKVISLTRKRLEKKIVPVQEKNRNVQSNTRVIAITSGKGGVGKTNIVANLGFALSKLGNKVLLLDADLALGNLDVLLGLTPRHNFLDVIMGSMTVPGITVEGPANMKILPASSGVQELSQLTKGIKARIFTGLDSLMHSIDILLIDTPSGISSNVIYFNKSAQEIIVVISPEPTSMTDAYALMKVLSLRYSKSDFKILVNMAMNGDEAHGVFRKMKQVSDRFLNVSIEYIGHILFDENVIKSVKLQKLVTDIYPDSAGSRCFAALANKIHITTPAYFSMGSNIPFWEQVLQNSLE